MSYFSGDVVWFNNPECPEKCRPHIILGKKDEKTYFVLSSTKVETTKKVVAHIEKKKFGDSLDTLVILPANTSQTIRETSAINCNKLTILNLVDFKSQDGNNFSAKNDDNIGKELLSEIKIGLNKSKLISIEIKDIINNF